MRPKEIPTHAQKLGPRIAGEEVRARLSSHEVNFGLRCDLHRLPAVKPAAIPLTVQAAGEGYRGFETELSATGGRDYGRVLRRKQLYENGLRTMYAAFAPDG